MSFLKIGAEPGDIQTIEDLRKLPIFMDKDRERQSMEVSLQKYGHTKIIATPFSGLLIVDEH